MECLFLALPVALVDDGAFTDAWLSFRGDCLMNLGKLNRLSVCRVWAGMGATNSTGEEKAFGDPLSVISWRAALLLVVDTLSWMTASMMVARMVLSMVDMKHSTKEHLMDGPRA